MILKFKSLGHQVSHLPLLNIEKNYEKINFSDYGGIIFTSANAIKYLDYNNLNKILFVFVLEASLKKARNAGFQNTIAAEGNVLNLKELILQNYLSKDKPLLYISGEIISTDLDQQLLHEGYSVKRIINYKVSHNEKFNENFIKELKLNIPDIVYVYSQNSASSFLNFIKIYQIENIWMNTNLMCIGEKTSSILNEIKWKKFFFLILEKRSFCYIKFDYGIDK